MCSSHSPSHSQVPLYLGCVLFNADSTSQTTHNKRVTQVRVQMLDAQKEQESLHAQVHDSIRDKALLTDQVTVMEGQMRHAREELESLKLAHRTTEASLATTRAQLVDAQAACGRLEATCKQLHSTVTQQTRDVGVMDVKYQQMEVGLGMCKQGCTVFQALCACTCEMLMLCSSYKKFPCRIEAEVLLTTACRPNIFQSCHGVLCSRAAWHSLGRFLAVFVL
jgi:hypothetical protein